MTELHLWRFSLYLPWTWDLCVCRFGTDDWWMLRVGGIWVDLWEAEPTDEVFLERWGVGYRDGWVVFRGRV